MSTFGRILIGCAVFGGFLWLFAQQPTEEGQRAIVMLFFALLLYFLPWFIALNRNHHNAAAIGMLTLLLGWTFLGWAIALIWAFTAVRETSRQPELELEPSRSRGDVTIGWHRRHPEVS